MYKYINMYPIDTDQWHKDVLATEADNWADGPFERSFNYIQI